MTEQEVLRRALLRYLQWYHGSLGPAYSEGFEDFEALARLRQMAGGHWCRGEGGKLVFVSDAEPGEGAE